MKNNFECIFLSVGGDCMDNPDIETWEECGGCEKTNSCEFCIWPTLKADEDYCKNCTMREDKDD